MTTVVSCQSLQHVIRLQWIRPVPDPVLIYTVEKVHFIGTQSDFGVSAECHIAG